MIYIDDKLLHMTAPMKDAVIKILLGAPQNRSILQNFLQMMTGEKQEILNVIQENTWGKEKLEEKQMRGDLVVETTKDTHLIETQHYRDKGFENRMLGEEARLVLRQFTQANTYENMKNIKIHIVTDQSIPRVPGLYEKAIRVLEDHRNMTVFNLVQYYILNIKKLKNIDYEDIRHQWAIFLEFKNKEDLQMVAEKNEEIKKAIREVHRLLGDPKIREEIQEMIDIQRRKEWELKDAERRGTMRGEKRGIEKGKRLGIAEGEEKAQLITVKNMIQEGIEDAVIMKVTNISEKELKKKKALLAV